MTTPDTLPAGNVLNKIMAATGRVTPDAVKAKLHTGLSEPGSGP